MIEYHVRVREFNLTAEEYGNLTIISVKPSTEGAEGDEFTDQVLITSESGPRDDNTSSSRKKSNYVRNSIFLAPLKIEVFRFFLADVFGS